MELSLGHLPTAACACFLFCFHIAFCICTLLVSYMGLCTLEGHNIRQNMKFMLEHFFILWKTLGITKYLGDISAKSGRSLE